MTIFNGQMENAAERMISLMRDLYSTLDTWRLNFEDTKNPMVTYENPTKPVANALEVTLNYVCEQMKEKYDELNDFNTEYGTAFEQSKLYGTFWKTRLDDCIAGLNTLYTLMDGKIKTNYEDKDGKELAMELTTADRTAIANEFKAVLNIT